MFHLIKSNGFMKNTVRYGFDFFYWQDWIGFISGRNLKDYGLRVEFNSLVIGAAMD